MSENKKDKKIDLSYVEVPATVDADVVVNLEDVLDHLSLAELKAVKEFVDYAMKCYEDCELQYENIKELRTAITNFRHESSISGSEKATLQALVKLDDNLAWSLYFALSEFIDKFLF
ncbi:MAG: hypothetical protein ACFFDF_25590 [Candidatus Odinarchaeota archaeon]